MNPYKYEIIQKMLIQTADQNYAVARFSFLNQLYFDFFWSSVHALEKYYKATLLLNGRTAIGYHHNIEKLHHDVSEICDIISDLNFEKPNFMPDNKWIDEPLTKFISRINQSGNPNNRYNTYGFSCFSSDIWKLDFLIWNIRRCCRPLNECPFVDGETWLDFLKNNPKEWQHSRFELLEKAINNEKISEELKNVLLKGNNAFLPEKAMLFRGLGVSANNSPISMLFTWIGDVSSKTSQDKIEAIEWAVSNVHFSKENKQEIETELERIKAIHIETGTMKEQA